MGVEIRLVDSNSALAKKIAQYARSTVLRKMREVQANVEEEIRAILQNRLGELPTIQALLGSYPYDQRKDLQAAVGLTDEMADNAVNEFIDDIADSFIIQVTDKDPFPELRLRIGGEGIRRAAEKASYVSEKSGEEIPWGTWIVEGESDPIFHSLVHIENATNILASNEAITKFIAASRSGRALMAPFGSFDIRQDTSMPLGEDFFEAILTKGTIDKIVKTLRFELKDKFRNVSI